MFLLRRNRFAPGAPNPSRPLQVDGQQPIFFTRRNAAENSE